MTRREAARYFTQGEGWTPSTGCTEAGRSFTDVHCGDQDWQPIETFFDQGITAGCGSGNFCPDTAITRGQMMVFLLKVEHGSSYSPPACTGVFADVPCPSGQFVDWIERAYNEGLTAGCGGSNFCPNANVNEWQMAVYLNKPVIAPNYRTIPGGTWYTLRDDQNRVTTEFYESFPGRDNIYLGNLLVASYVSHGNSGTPGWNFHSSDHLGTVRLTVNGSTGATIESQKYWPYGDKVGTPGAPIQKLAFASMERDPENNHYFDHHRKQDFNLGRFVSVDKIRGKSRYPQSWNRYSYVLNNPLKFVDPKGLYVSGCALVELACFDKMASFENARMENAKSADAQVRASAAALGELGEKNGVTVRPYTAQETATLGATARHGFTGPLDPTVRGTRQLLVAFNPLSPSLGRTVAHEGSHVFDRLRFLNSFDPKSGTYDFSLNFTHYFTEFHAYDVGGRVTAYGTIEPGPAGWGELDRILTSGDWPERDQFIFNPDEYPQE